MLLFKDKRHASIKEGEKTQVIIKINLTLEEEDLLNQAYETIQQVKQIYDFSNLDSFFTSLAKNLEISEEKSPEKLSDPEFIQEFLQMFILSNFFKPHEKHSKKLVLNFRDHSFAHRFKIIQTNALIDKLTFLNLKPLCIEPNLAENK
jgi:predicted DNA-binding antitoxin AbrB/MazE fold protein